ncbi:hypothetical protein [Mucilaginibacter myungsuensis]|uniref:LapA family protein n=1 Tax=Mucilaginibacter myungsuensis TaxID=649104 RepID=A0A929L0Y2_9SPHI|nr:hypothetical protein [Mucilaginibacter myungsuensis]MBE9662489.1 hypothetical protein [Mucilaginibacter myungsuensis]MDN3597908.1 hypothetical protein [Mucilaginibacter myungsuensis]
MRLKTIFLIVVTILLTVVIMQNADQVYFEVLFFTIRTSKLMMMLWVAIAAFVIGYLVGRPNIKKFGDQQGYDADDKNNGDADTGYRDRRNTLSDEDRDYISED